MPHYETFQLTPHDWVPNNPRLPILLYRKVLQAKDLAAAFEKIFSNNAWPPQWRDGIFDYHHYHSTAHEALGCAAGTAVLILGGPGGKEVTVNAGDALLLPAGTGHCCLSASADFLVVGAYPRGQDFDICRQAPTAEMLERIKGLPFPNTDPIFGDDPALTEIWRA